MLEESANPIYMNVRIGAILSIQLSAAGQVFAVHLPEEVVMKAAALQVHTLPTSARKFTSAQLREMRKEVRADGYAAVAGLNVPALGVRAVAAPVYDHKGNVFVVIGILGRGADLSLSRDSPHIKSLLEGAAVASERLGYDEEAIDQQDG